MPKSELAVVLILRVVGVTGLFAAPAIFLPFGWMDAIHQSVGLGALPDAPIVSYLARSLSAFYSAFATVTLYISSDVKRYSGLVVLWGILFLALGCLLLGIDLAAGMPTVWTVAEGPPSMLIGLAVIWLQRSGSRQ